jgi:hypothetical protein
VFESRLQIAGAVADVGTEAEIDGLSCHSG